MIHMDFKSLEKRILEQSDNIRVKIKQCVETQEYEKCRCYKNQLIDLQNTYRNAAERYKDWSSMKQDLKKILGYDYNVVDKP